MGVTQEDISGSKYGLLTAIKWIKNEKHFTKTGKIVYHNYWEFKCDCGSIKVLRKGRVKPYGRTSIKSCGCLRNLNKRKGYKDLSGSQWSTIKKNAEKRNLKFEITEIYIWEIFEKQNRKCALSGKPIRLDAKNPWYRKTTASLDRIDSSKGYIKGNVHWVHKDVNCMKWGLEMKRFLQLVEQIYFNSVYKGD